MPSRRTTPSGEQLEWKLVRRAEWRIRQGETTVAVKGHYELCLSPVGRVYRGTGARDGERVLRDGRPQGLPSSGLRVRTTRRVVGRGGIALPEFGDSLVARSPRRGLLAPDLRPHSRAIAELAERRAVHP